MINMVMKMKDCAIVCGYPTNEDGTISEILKSRIEKAIELYQQHQIEYIIVSGGAIHNNYSEALTMRDYAIKYDIPKNKILIENQAKSTYHNMVYSKEIMKEYQLKSCYVITNSWHIIKAKYYAKQFLNDFEMIECAKPKNMTSFKVILLHIYMPINMFMNRLKGYK